MSSPNEYVLQVQNVSHRYAANWALRKVSLAFTHSQSGIVALLGVNGAGKSTLMNILCGVLYQTEGDALIDGVSIRESPLEAKRSIGFLPQQVPVHMELTVDEFLRHCAVLRNMPNAEISDALNAVIGKCGLAKVRGRLIANLSGGYRQRVGIAQAIIHQPNVVVLDEPMNGLDPNQIAGVKDLIKEIAENTFVFLSSHILADVKVLCSRVVMMDGGRIVFNDSMDAFEEYTEPRAITLDMLNPPVVDELLAMDGVSAARIEKAGRVRLTFDGDRNIAERLVCKAASANWRLREIYFERSTLEDTFARLSIKRTDGDEQL